MLSITFWLMASWATKPYYYGPDLPYALGWLTLALAGTGGRYTIESWLDREFDGGMADDPVSPDGSRGVAMAVLTREAPPDGHVFEDIADAMPHMVWLAGPDGGTTYHNRRILEYAGLTAGMPLPPGFKLPF